MTVKAWITAPFAQPTTQGTPVSPVSDHPVMIALPVAVGHDDSTMIFRSALLKREATGSDLVTAFDRLAMVHPQVASQVVAAGSLGGLVHWGRAVRTLGVYMTTGTAMVPQLGV